MLHVYINNILSKNGQTKQFINIVENENNPYVISIEEIVRNNIKKFIKTILIYFDLHKKLKNNIVPETLKLGDFYLEIVDLSPIENIINDKYSLLQESIVIEENKKQISKIANLAVFEDCRFNKNIIIEDENYESKSMDFSHKMAKLLLKKEPNLIEEGVLDFWQDVVNSNDSSKEIHYNNFSIEDFQELDFEFLENIYLRTISPSNVLKIEKDGNHYGFLIIEEMEDNDGAGNEINLYQRFLRDDTDGSVNDNTFGKTEEKLADALVNSVTQKLAEIVSHTDHFFSEFPEDLHTSLKIIAYEKIKKKSKLKFRFLQSDRLINFHTNIDKYKPYGTSIYDPIVLPVKMYTIALMSSVISRLSRAAVVRKWNVEVGAKRNYPEMIEKIKKDLKTKSISYENLNSIRNISQVLTDFRDIAVVSQNGQRFIDLEILPTHDRALPLNDMMDLRNELIAATGVPSVYLNVGDAIELRETLVNINIGFSHTISGLQSYFEEGLNNLLNSLFEIILQKNNIKADFKLSQYFRITLNHPLVLQLQNNESVLSTVTNIVGLLRNADVKFDPMVLFRKYLPEFNWDELENSADTMIKKEKKEQLMQGQQQ
jgi:hypothetical protein